MGGESWSYYRSLWPQVARLAVRGKRGGLGEGAEAMYANACQVFVIGNWETQRGTGVFKYVGCTFAPPSHRPAI